MRWCSFTTASGGPARLGAVAWGDSGKVLDVGAWARSRDAETPADLIDLVESSTATQERVTELVRSAPADGLGWVRKAEARLLAPLRAPNSIRRLTAVPDERVPTFAHLNRRAVLGSGDEVVWPSYTRQLVHTHQVAAVVGRRARDLPSTDADRFVFGYALAVVWTAADRCRDVALSLGPWLVTPDEWCPDSGRWSFGQLLSWASQHEELWPSDVLVGDSGDVPVLPGQTVDVGIEGLGSVTHQLVTPASTASL